MPSDREKQLVGAEVPDRLFHLISLYSMSRGVSKSQIIRDSLLLWIEQNEVDIEQIIPELRRTFQDEWRRIKNQREEKEPHTEEAPIPLTKSGFITSRSAKLEEQKIPPHIIAEIFKGF